MPFYLTKLKKAIALNKKAIIAAKRQKLIVGWNITLIMFKFWLSCRKLFCKLAYGLQNSAVKVKRGLGLKKEKNEFKLIANGGEAEGNTCGLLSNPTENKASKAGEGYVEYLKKRYSDFDVLINSGYFSSTILIMLFVASANSINALAKSEHFLATYSIL